MNDRTEEWRELNRASWDVRVHIHLGGSFYDAAGFRDRRDSLKDFEKAEVGDVTGKRLLHLFLHEHDHTFYRQRQSLQRHPDEIYRHPAGAPRYPLTYSIRARKP